jgi:hypothetical protein
MPVIGHQAIGEQSCFRSLDGFFEHLFHGGKVGRLAEKPHPSHAPIEHVVYQPARSCTNSPWHANSIPERVSLSIETTSDPILFGTIVAQRYHDDKVVETPMECQGRARPGRRLPHRGMAARAQQQTHCVSIVTAVVLGDVVWKSC